MSTDFPFTCTAGSAWESMKWKYENAASAPARFAGTLAAVSFHRRRSVCTSRRTRSSPTMYTLFAMISASPPRKEDRRLLTGAGRYVDELTREGMLHLGVVRSAEAHARITKLALDEEIGRASCRERV